MSKKTIAATLTGLLVFGPGPTSAGGAQSLPPRDPNRPVAVFVLDMAGNGFEFTSKADGVMFDLDGTGKPIRIGWTKPNSDESFLFLDANGNGRVDGGRELIGDGMRKVDGTRVYGGDEALNVIQGLNGYLPLGPVSPDLEHYVWVDEKDEAFAKIRVWTDVNHNGLSEPNELRALADASVLRIYTGFTLNKRIPDSAENTQRMLGHFNLNPAPGCRPQPGASCAVERRMAFMEFAR